MKKTTLLIMAAGIGSRFGTGIKQLEPVGLHDEIIMDYSIHDAILAGFNKIIFVIRKDIEADFRERIGKRVEAICASLNVEIAYAFQNLSSIPTGYTVPNGRTKPWGTGQAVLAAKDLIHEPFAVINADDYYGKEAFRKLHDWLVLDHNDSAIAMAGFILKNTLSDNGGVTRGVCKVVEGHTHITDVVETSNIVKTVEDGMLGAEANGVKLDPGSYVSMNFWGFPAKEGHDPAFLTALEDGFEDFFEKQVPANPQKAEYLLPTLIGGLLRDGKCTVKVLETKDNWFGVTYKEGFVMNPITPAELAAYFDHTQLRAYAQRGDFEKLCAEAREYGFAMVAINPAPVSLCKDLLAGTSVHVGAAVGFPLGQSTPQVKKYEAVDAIANGADEIDYVINITQLKEKNYDFIEHEMTGIVEECRGAGVISKVIFENCYLTEEEKRALCSIAREVRPDFIKTSTGFGTGGATFEDVALMKKCVGDEVKIKAAGGIRTLDTALRMIELGVSRIGSTASVSIVEELKHRL